MYLLNTGIINVLKLTLLELTALGLDFLDLVSFGLDSLDLTSCWECKR